MRDAKPLVKSMWWPEPMQAYEAVTRPWPYPTRWQRLRWRLRNTYRALCWRLAMWLVDR